MLRTLTPLPDPAVGETEFRDALRLFASGVTIITTLDPAGAPHGMTATAFSSLSLSPPLVMVAVAEGTRCHRQVIAQRRFGVSILSGQQVDASRHFGGRPSASFKPRFHLLSGLPVLDGSMVTLACDLDKVVDGGDHLIFIGLVKATSTRDGEPLLHFKGRYRSLVHETT